MAPSLSPTHVTSKSTELELNHHFRTRMVQIFLDELNAEFWQRSVLQASHSEAAVWHASNSVAGFTWAQDLSRRGELDAANRMVKESIKQRGLSIKRTHLMAQSPRLSAQAMAVMLVASALLSLTPPAPGSSQDSSQILLEQSFQLVRYWRFWENVDSGPSSTLATHLLYYFVKGERMMQESALETRQEPLDTWYEAISWLQRHPLTSAVRAYVELEMIWSSVRSILERLPFKPTTADVASAIKTRSILGRKFAVWEARFDALPSSTVMVTSRGRAVLSARCNLLKISLRLDLSKFTGLWDEICGDEFFPEFSDTLDLLLLGLAEDDGSRSQSQDAHAFSPLHWNALNFIARVCREPLLRCRAASLLGASLRAMVRSKLPATAEETSIGGKSNSPLLADRIIELEEGAYTDCCSKPQKCRRGQYICNMHRVARVQLVRLAVNATYTLYTVEDILNGGPGRTIQLGRVAVWS
ncbi:hypothetical protein NLG97_g4825 [Lecanicillium saksenae]|uniref:Uncharacterized protein n=1 Tax=Lecanicillium saksenae TaxID=468837 RepID=A0ACC1QW20_9HYPO|nr:hypothetical protein NLG97_g4825 [Lecanicillium saksenae]